MLIVVIAIVTLLNAHYANDAQNPQTTSLFTAFGHFMGRVNWTCLFKNAWQRTSG